MLAAGALAANVFLTTFAGSWTCTLTVPGNARPAVTHWQIGAATRSAWTMVRWEAPETGGTAFVGFVAPGKHWIFQDFHDDGSYDSITSKGPQNGVWTWSGLFVTSWNVERGASQWRIVDGKLRRGFGRLLGPSFRESAHDSCART